MIKGHSCPQIVHIVIFSHANIISNVKHVYLYYITIIYTPHILFLNPDFILKKPIPAYSIAIFNAPNSSLSCHSCLILN